MSASARCKGEADKQIEQIRRSKGVNGKMSEISELATDTDAALAILADNLYQDSSHFLFELLQNADDNSFSDAIMPTLNIVLYSRDGSLYLRTDCNERGFLLKDLHAICRIGQSTKSVATDGTRSSIGEKALDSNLCSEWQKS
ncbi:hypothetical protein K4F52_001169 [Lecanicillium sp. MT-2017a]|nr:hypothetical protein K4F52_001169 [Lecanicillium sp. MT-2017a]